MKAVIDPEQWKLQNSPTAREKRARYHPKREAIMLTPLAPPASPSSVLGIELKRLSDEIEVLKVRLSEIERRTGIHEPTGE